MTANNQVGETHISLDHVSAATSQLERAMDALKQSILLQANKVLVEAMNLQQDIRCPESVLVLTHTGVRFVEVGAGVNLNDLTQNIKITAAAERAGQEQL